MGVREMNAFTFIAMIVIAICIIIYASTCLASYYTHNAKIQGAERLNRYHADVDRLNKTGSWNVNEGWK